MVGLASSADAQEIQLTGPLAGAPAVRKLRLHRQGRFEIAPGVAFTLLDQYERTLMPGAKATYHITDWFGVGLYGGFGVSYTTALTEELQAKAVDSRRCDANPAAKACRLTAVNLTRGGITNPDGSKTTGKLADDQLGKISWVLAPQLTFVPFRGKLALFSALFVDTDVDFFVGPAIVGLNERAPCGQNDDGTPVAACSKNFSVASRVAVAPTFGLGLNFYPLQYLGFGAEFRALPFNWNTSGFDNHGGGPDGSFPDNAVNGKDSEFHFNSLLSLHVSVQFPTTIKSSE